MSEDKQRPHVRRWGFLSEKQAQLSGTHIYSTPAGLEAEVSEVCPDEASAQDNAARWPDSGALIACSEWRRTGRPRDAFHGLCAPEELEYPTNGFRR